MLLEWLRWMPLAVGSRWKGGLCSLLDSGGEGTGGVRDGTGGD
jgi:hypothetical protein